VNWTQLTENPVAAIYKHQNDHSSSLERRNFLTK